MKSNIIVLSLLFVGNHLIAADPLTGAAVLAGMEVVKVGYHKLSGDEAREKQQQKANQAAAERKEGRESLALVQKGNELALRGSIHADKLNQKHNLFNDGWENVADVLSQFGTQGAQIAAAFYEHSNQVRQYELDTEMAMRERELEQRERRYEAEMMMRASELSERSEKHRDEMAMRAAELQVAREKNDSSNCALM
jgi:hypothetical protein